MQNTQLLHAAVRPDILGKMLLGEQALFQHQAEILQLMAPLIYPDQAQKNTAIMWPRQTGLTTTLAVMAIHHALFSPMKTAAFLLGRAVDVKIFEAMLDELYGRLQTSQRISIPLSAQPGKLVVKVASLAAIRALRGQGVSAIYLDTPTGMDSTETLQRITTAMESEEPSPRIHLSTSGWNAAIAKVVETGQVRGTPFTGHTVDIKKIASPETLDEHISNLGINAFIAEFACMDPGNPNALAEFNAR